jgi:predicted nucleotidyltransferase
VTALVDHLLTLPVWLVLLVTGALVFAEDALFVLRTALHRDLIEPLTELLLRAFGPRQVVAEALTGLAGIQEAYIFGSWAARYTGHAGRAPADIDVLVIGAPDRDDLDDAAQRATTRLAREVNITLRSPTWWRDGDDGFHKEITNRPLVPIIEQEPQ